MRNLIAVLLTTLILFSCSSSQSEDLSFLMSGESFVKMSIGGKPFYADKNQFLGKLTVSESSIRTSLSDIDMSNIQLELTKKGLLKNISEPIMISTNPGGTYKDYGNMLIGKRKDDGFEGYMLSKGTFQWTEWSKEMAILHCQGFVISPGQAFIPENEIPFEGIIYFKSPSINTDGLNNSEIF